MLCNAEDKRLEPKAHVLMVLRGLKGQGYMVGEEGGDEASQENTVTIVVSIKFVTICFYPYSLDSVLLVLITPIHVCKSLI